MLKDIVVNLAVGAKSDPAAEYAVSIAQTFDTNITGLAFALKPVVPATAIEAVSLNVIGSAINENEQAAKAAIDRFESFAKMAGISTETLMITEMLIEAADQFSKMTRCFDLSVVTQSNPDGHGFDDVFIEAALFTSGRPVVIVPYIHKAPIKLDRIICCWDGSQCAARAIADAMPLLHKAKKIDLLMVRTRKTESQRIAGTDMAQHLARHRLNVSIEKIVAPDSDVTNVVLSYAADCSADFLVMGGYGHSRWRELILGGATRGILSSMTVPTLMSH